jgi:hypothetical protein
MVQVLVLVLVLMLVRVLAALVVGGHWYHSM